MKKSAFLITTIIVAIIGIAYAADVTFSISFKIPSSNESNLVPLEQYQKTSKSVLISF